jgi:hypothetical protein
MVMSELTYCTSAYLKTEGILWATCGYVQIIKWPCEYICNMMMYVEVDFPLTLLSLLVEHDAWLPSVHFPPLLYSPSHTDGLRDMSWFKIVAN